MVELHKLPQPERQSVQKLKTCISEISKLASLGGFTRILKDVAQQAMSLQLPDGSCSAFVIKAELRPVLERLIEVDDTLNTTMQIHLDTMETTFKSLVKSPDGTPYAMFSRAVDFSSRRSFFFLFTLDQMIRSLLFRQSAEPEDGPLLNFPFRKTDFSKKTFVHLVSGLSTSHVTDTRDDEMLRMVRHSVLLSFDTACPLYIGSPVASGSGNDSCHLCTASRSLSASS